MKTVWDKEQENVENERQKGTFIMQKFCDFSNKIDDLADRHKKLGKFTKEFQEANFIQMFITNVFLSVMSQAFCSYIITITGKVRQPTYQNQLWQQH